MNADGFHVFGDDPAVLTWAQAAHRVAVKLAQDPDIRAANLRHRDTWFLGVDALPNGADGAIKGVPLSGPWAAHIAPPQHWHRAQLSIVYPGYPGRDDSETEANHRYRIKRAAAHVDGLLPEGTDKRRFLREPHGFILGLPLNVADAAPLTIWPGSQRIMGDAFRALIGEQDPATVDLTEGYQAARRQCFEQITPQQIVARPGQSILLHRHLLHGVAPWEPQQKAPPEGRMIAYFRPQICGKEWCLDP